MAFQKKNVILKNKKEKKELGSLEVNKEGKLIEQTNVFGTYHEVTGVYPVKMGRKKTEYYWYYNYGK